MWSGQRSARGLLTKPTNRLVIIYIRFFMYQGYEILFFVSPAVEGLISKYVDRKKGTNFLS